MCITVLVWFRCLNIRLDLLIRLQSITFIRGDVYFQAPAEEVDDMVSELARGSRKHHLPKNWKGVRMLDSRESLCAMFPVKTLARLGEHERLAPSDGSAYICDLEHHPGSKGPVSGSMFCSQLTHNRIFSFGVGRLATPNECLSAMGFDCYPELSGGRPPSPVVSAWADLPDGAKRFLSGKSVNIPSAVTFMLFCLAHTARRADFNVLCAAPSTPEDADAALDDAWQ